MIEYVDKVLKHWAQEMSVSRAHVNLGYCRGRVWGSGMMELVSNSGSGRLTARGTATRSGPVVGRISKVAERVNQAIERLPEDLQEIINLHYLDYPSASVVEKAQMLGCSRKTFYENIHRGHRFLSDDLPDTYANFGDRYPHCG
jgi:hypothetical protein